MVRAVDVCLAGPIGMEEGDKQRFSSHTCQQLCLWRRTSESRCQVADGIVQECATNIQSVLVGCSCGTSTMHNIESALKLRTGSSRSCLVIARLKIMREIHAVLYHMLHQKLCCDASMR